MSKFRFPFYQQFDTSGGPRLLLQPEVYRPLVFRWAKILVRKTEDADDLCQEVCLRCLTGETTFRGEAEFSTWLYRITLNAFKDRLRNKRTKREITEADIDPKALKIADELYGIEKSHSEHPLVDDSVNAALQILPPRHVKLLKWKYIEGFSQAEIAEYLNIQEKSVGRSLHRARQAFKRAYRGVNQGEVSSRPLKNSSFSQIANRLSEFNMIVCILTFINV